MRLTPKRVILFSIIALIILIVGFVSLSIFGPLTPIVVSRETTYLTEPLDQWGNVDYVEAIRRQLSDGVTPENNAAALIWQALGPVEVPAERRSAFYSELGIAPLPSDGDYFVEINSNEALKQMAIGWMRNHQPPAVNALTEGMPPDPDMVAADLEYQRQTADVDAFDGFTQLAERTRYEPWNAAELPPLAEWLKQNQTPLDLAVKASKRPKYYSPLVVDSSTGARLLTMLLPDIQSSRGLARGLCHRAMLHLGEGRPREAWQDLQAVHRLARLIGQQGVLVQQLVAIAIDQMALRADAAVLHEGNLSADELRDMRAFLVQLTPPCDIGLSIDRFERFTILDVLNNWAQDGVRDPGFGFGDLAGTLLTARVDWNLPMQMANRWYDRMVAAMDRPTIAERRAAMEKVESDLQAMEAGIRTPGNLIGAIFSSRKRSEVVGKVMLALLLPATSAAQHAEDRSGVSLQLTRIAAALAVHRKESGAYPASLDGLAADLRANLPVDPFSAKAFLYEKRSDGYVLWSVGRNLTDDKASGREFCPTVEGEPAPEDRNLGSDRDDIVLRVPWDEPNRPGTDEGG